MTAGGNKATWGQAGLPADRDPASAGVMKSWRTARIEPQATGKHWEDWRSAGRGGHGDGAVLSRSEGRVQIRPTEMKTKLDPKVLADPESENSPGGIFENVPAESWF